MSAIQVDQITNQAGTGAPTLTHGATIPVGYAITCAGGLNVVGVLTATTFSGDGSGLTNIVTCTEGQAISFKLLFNYDNCHRA